MLTHPLLADHMLLELSDLHQDAPYPLPDATLAQLRAVVGWSRDYLRAPHPELGRRGPVCPFVQGSQERDVFYLAVHHGTEVEEKELDDVLAVYRDWFRQLEPVAGPAAQFKTILIVLPDLAVERARDVVDAAQARLKAAYTEDGLMIGEFHDGPPAKGGLWNPDFRPLRSPVPLLAIRHMVPSDFPFLVDDPTTLAAYLRLFGDAAPDGVRRQVTAAASRFGLPVPDSVAGRTILLNPVEEGVS